MLAKPRDDLASAQAPAGIGPKAVVEAKSHRWRFYGAMVLASLLLIWIESSGRRSANVAHPEVSSQNGGIEEVVLRALHLRLAAGTSALPAPRVRSVGPFTDGDVAEARRFAVAQLEGVFDAKSMANEVTNVNRKVDSERASTRVTFAEIRSPRLSVSAKNDKASVAGTVVSVARLIERTYDGRTIVHNPTATTEVRAELIRTVANGWLIDALEVKPRV